MRRASKVDENQAEIVKALRTAGIWACSTAALGNGFPDLLVWHRAFYIFELKDGRKPPSERKLTPKEQAFARGCPGPVHVALCPEDVFQVLGLTLSKGSQCDDCDGHGWSGKKGIEPCGTCGEPKA